MREGGRSYLLIAECSKGEAVVRGFFGIGIYHPKHECNQGTLWRSAYCFGASFLFTIGPRFRRQAADTTKSWQHLPALNYTNIGDLKAHLPHDCPLVGIELTAGAKPLSQFWHPKRACYLLGAEDHGLPQSVLEECHYTVVIEGLRACLNVATAGSLVLYDRQQKQKGVADEPNRWFDPVP